MNILEAEHLTKSFGANRVLRDLSFHVPEHEVFGFMGQNGAGKTTTMKLALGLLKADSGQVTICGEAVRYGDTRTNRFVGYLPDVPEFYGYMRPREYLRLCGEITGLDAKKIKGRSDELLSLVGLEKVNKKIGGFSRGMKQRLGIAQALLHEPRLLLCDEPTSALDPIGRKEILDILAAIKGKTTVVFSTHILSDVERICDSVAILHSGTLALSGTLAEIRAQHRQDGLTVEFATLGEREAFTAAPELQDLPGTVEAKGSSAVIRARDITAAETYILALLARRRMTPLRLEVMEPTLESLFLEAVQ